MNLDFDMSLAAGYKSSSQIIRRVSEGWAAHNLYCPRCNAPQLLQYPNNRKVADFYCPNCSQQFEMKSTNTSIQHRVMDGAYDSFIERINANDNPDFFIMRYSKDRMCVDDLLVIPNHFFHSGVVEKRKPLADSARRAGWIGCNILLSAIPSQGKIAIVKDRIPVARDVVAYHMRAAGMLNTSAINARGWMLDVLNCVNRLPLIFSLGDVYRFETELLDKHPQNRNIRPKIRQQLQQLRDRGIIRFLGGGHYQRVL